MDLLEQLADAYLNGEQNFQFVYNRKTKEVFLPDESEEDWEEDENLELIPYKESREMYEVMVKFSNQFEGAIEQALYQALNGRKPFQAFKKVIAEKGLQDDWYNYELAFAKQQMSEWLQSI